MKRFAAVLAGTGIAVAAMAPSVGCGAVRDRIAGAKSTPTVTHTPRPSATATATPTLTPVPTPSATPTPPLPPNPDGLSRWETLPVTFCVSSLGDGYVTREEFVASVDRAFSEWGVPFLDNGDCGPVRTEDGVDEIGWGDLSADSSPGRLYEAGLTQTTTSECTSGCDPNRRIRIKESDITIDAMPPRQFRTARCLYGTMLHEVGHFLGLEHLPFPAVMAAQTSGCPDTLTAADRAALLARYGALAGG